MANIFQKAEKLAATALALLQREIGVAGLFVHKYGEADYRGAKGDTINVKRPPILRARDAGFRTRNSLVVDSLQQSRIQVKLAKHPYSRVELTPEEITLDEVDYVRDVQAPQVRALVEDFEETIVGALRDGEFALEVDFIHGTTTESYPYDPRYVAGRAKKLLDDNKVPATGRYWLVGSAVSEAIASCKGLLEVDKAGVPEALRDGVVGRLRGFTVIDWPVLSEGESYFVHNTAVAPSAVAPRVPAGAKAGATVSANGLAVTQVWDYNSETMGDQSTVHAFTGADLVLDPEIGNDGKVVMDGDEPVMDFVRAVQVNFMSAADNAKGTVWTLASSGTVSGGTFTLSVDGDATDEIAFDASNDVIKGELNELPGVSGVKVTGTTSKTIAFTKGVVLTVNSAAITGGGSKTVAKVS